MPRQFRGSSGRGTRACCRQGAERPLPRESESPFSCCQVRQPSDASPESVSKLYIIEDTGMRLKYNRRVDSGQFPSGRSLVHLLGRKKRARLRAGLSFRPLRDCHATDESACASPTMTSAPWGTPKALVVLTTTWIARTRIPMLWAPEHGGA